MFQEILQGGGGGSSITMKLCGQGDGWRDASLTFQNTSYKKLHIDSLDSGITVAYCLVNNNTNERVYGGEEYNLAVGDFVRLLVGDTELNVGLNFTLS